MNQGIRLIFNRRTKLIDDDGSASSSDDADDHCDSEIKKDEEVSALDIDALVHVAVELENLVPVTIVKQSSFSKHRKTRRAMRAELAEELEMARMNSSQEWSVASSDAGQISELETNATRIPRSEGTSRRSTSRGRRSSSRDRGELTRTSCEDAIRQVRERSSERRPRRGSKDKILASADNNGEQDRQIAPIIQTEAGGSDQKEQGASISPGETSSIEKKKEKKPPSSSRQSNGSLATSRHSVASGKPSLEKSMSSRRIETRKDRGSELKRSSSGHFPRTSLGGSQANDTESAKRGSSGSKQGTSKHRSPTREDDSPKETYADKADCSESKSPTTPEISNVSPLSENPARALENATPVAHSARRVGSNHQSSSRRIVLRKKASSEDLTSKVSKKDSRDVTSNQELTVQKDLAPSQHRDSRSSSSSELKHRSGSVDRNKRRSASHDDSVPQPLRSSRFEKGKQSATVDIDSHSDDDSDSSLDFHKCFPNGTSSKSVGKALEKQVERVTPSSFVSRFGDKTADRGSKTATAPKTAHGRERRPIRKISLQLKPLKSEATTPSLVAGEGTLLEAHQNRSFRRENQAARAPGRSKSEEWSSVPPVDSVDHERAKKAQSLHQSTHSQQAREKGIPRHSTREDVKRVAHFFSWDDDDTDDDDSSVEMVVQAIDYEKNMDRKRLLCKANSVSSLVGKGSKQSTEKAPSSIRSLRM